MKAISSVRLLLGAALWLYLGSVVEAAPVVGSKPLTVTSATLSQIAVTAPSASLPVGATQSYTATGIYSDGSSVDLTDLVTWSSSVPGLASITPDGLATGVKFDANPVQITAAFGGRTGTANLTVNSATLSQIAVTAATAAIPKGIVQEYTATGTYSNGTKFDLTDLATWSSSAPAVATITKEGLVTGVQFDANPVQIIAAFGGRTGAANLTVNSATLAQITVTAPATTIPKGVSQAYKATGTYSNGSTFDLTDQATWASSAPSIASITAEGLATGVQSSATPVQIIAAFDGFVGVANLTVNLATVTAITVTAPHSSIPLGTTQQYSATGTFSDGSTFDVTDLATWTSSAPSIAGVTADGLATGVQANVTPVNIVASVVVNNKPSAVLRATPTTGSAPLNVSFSGALSFDPDAGDSIHEYRFTFGDGSPPIVMPTPTISHLYAAPGTYVASLVVVDTQGNLSSSTSFQIVVTQNQKPSAVLQATPTTGFAPLTVSLSGANSVDPDAGDSIKEYRFTFGDGSPPVVQTTPTRSQVYGAPGTYVASLVVVDAQGNESNSVFIQIVVPNRNPSAFLQATPTTGFAPLNVSFSGAQSFDPDPGGIKEYIFTPGDGSPPVVQTTPTRSHLYGAPGTYVASLVVKDPQGNVSSSVFLQIVVSANNKPTAVLQATPTTGFAPLTVSLSGAQSVDPDAGDSIKAYTFTPGDGSPPVVQNTPTRSHVYGAPGTYLAKLVVTDTQGNQSNSVFLQIVVTNRNPTAALQATPTTGIAPLTVNFSAAQSFDPDAGDRIKDYTFTFGDGSGPVVMPTPAISHVYSAPGTYVASLTVKDTLGNQSSSVALQIVVSNAISVTDATVLEGDVGTGKVVFTVTLAAPSTQPVTVRYATRDGTAVGGKDYTPTSGTLTFPAGVTSQNVVVLTVGEKLFEGDEPFFVDLSAPVNAVLAKASAKGVLTNDDPSIGETTMSPDRLKIDVGEKETLAVTWTHPVSWRQLDTIDVRIVDDEDTVLWVRFRHDQATDRVSFSLFNPESGKFGRPAAPGSSQRFETSSATLYLGESAVLGPPGRDVTLRLRFSVKPRTAGGVYRVEAFATDDDGHSQGFDGVGTLIVRGHKDGHKDDCRGHGHRDARDRDCDDDDDDDHGHRR
jgi:PKD repeat protein